MTSLSLVIITKNEAHNLPRCIESVPSAGEVVVVDSGSTDETVTVARRYTDKIFEHEWEGFGKAKQAALAHATGDWVLSLDADEVLDPQLAAAVEAVTCGKESDADGYRLKRLSNFLGAWIRHSGWYPDYVLRLGRRSRMSFTPDLVHERAVVTGKVRDLEGHLLHYTDPDLKHYLQKLHRYAALSASSLHARGRRAHISDLSVRPLYQFVRMYLLKAGFLDGVPGLILAGGSAFHVFTKYAQLWELGHKEADCLS